jgi:putative ABC transport system permease protein
VTSHPWGLRLALWLLRRRLAPDRLEFVLGDLEEEYRRRAPHAPAGAVLWLLRQTLDCLFEPPHTAQTASRHLARTRSNSLRYVREAVRSLRTRRPAVAASIAVIAVGVGSATMVAAAAHALLFRALPVPQHERLVTGVALREGVDPYGTSILEYRAFRDRGQSFAAMGLSRQLSSTLRMGGAPLRVRAASVDAGYLSAAGARAAIGRTISADDDRPGAPLVAVVSHGFWSVHLAQSPSILGTPLVLDGRAATIVGVMSNGFELPFAAEVWVPMQLAFDALPLEQQLASAYTFLARLRDDVGVADANREVSAIAAALAREHSQRRGWAYRLLGLRQQLTGDLDGRTTRIVALVVASALFLLVICCINAANLLLLQATERQRDEAVRLAIGASARELALERLAANALIGVSGGVLGVCIAAWVGPALATLNPVRTEAFASTLTAFRVDAAFASVGAVMSLVAIFAIGLVPQLRLGERPAIAAALASSAPRTGVSRAHRTQLRLLVAAQIAVAIVLLVAGGLVLRSFSALRHVDLGFEPRALVTSQLTLPPALTANHAMRSAAIERVLDAARSVPGVTGAAVTTNVPLQRVSIDSFYTVEGAPPGNANDVPITAHRAVTPGYLRMIGVRLLRGRLLRDTDGASAPRVAVDTETLAAQAWPGQDPGGRRVRRGRAGAIAPWLTVVGVVADVKEDRFNFRIDRAAWYMPYAQEDSAAPPNLVVEASGDPSVVARSVGERVRDVDPDLVMSDLVPLDSQVAELLTTERFAAVMLATLALSGLLLATLGLHSATAQIVSAQRAEIALRLAVGASRRRVVQMVVREVALVATAGTAAGTLVAAIAAPNLGAILFEVAPHDATTYASVALLLVGACSAAAWLPALRAARVDPARLLR